jgi:hypothetical protein
MMRPNQVDRAALGRTAAPRREARPPGAGRSKFGTGEAGLEALTASGSSRSQQDNFWPEPVRPYDIKVLS